MCRDGLNGWRHAIFESVLREMSDAYSVRLQRSLGVWPWMPGIPLPAAENSYIMASEGLCAFAVPLEHGRVFFSLWMFLGEIRIRVKVTGGLLAKALTSERDVVDEIVICFDGTPCDRMTSVNSDTLFDWIVKDKTVASSALMMRALGGDEEASALIADGIAKIWSHIYWSVMNILVSHGQRASGGGGGIGGGVYLVEARDGACDEVLRLLAAVEGCVAQRVVRQTEGRHFILTSCAHAGPMQEALSTFGAKVVCVEMESL